MGSSAHSLAMVEALRNRQTIDHQPQLSRRGVLGAGVVAASQILRGDYGSLLAQEVQYPSANELLRKLPEKIRLEGGTEATVEKVEVPDARYLLIAIRTVHKTNDPKEMTPEIKKVVDGCSGEIDQIIMRLYREFGVSTFAPEGYTSEKILSHHKTLQRLETVPQTIAALKKRNRFKEAVQLEQALRELEEELRSNIPYPSVLPLLKNDKMQIIATENEDAIAKDKKLEANPLAPSYIGIGLRDNASLQLLHSEIPRLQRGPGVIVPRGAGHIQSPKGKLLPACVEQWNNQHNNAKYSTMVITPSVTREYLRKHPLPPLPPDR